MATPIQALSGYLPAPYIFVGHQPKTIARTAAFVEYGVGTHKVTTSWGGATQLPDLHVLHYPIRGFDELENKIANANAFFKANYRLKASFACHWRRRIDLNPRGRLRGDSDRAFGS